MERPAQPTTTLLTSGREHRVAIGGREYVIAAPSADWLLARTEDAEIVGEAEANPYWGDLWPSAIALADYLAENPSEVRGKRIVELGAGLGLPSIVAATLGAARMTATDLVAESLEIAAANAARNGVGDRIEFCPLDWRCDDLPQDADLVMGADLIFDPEAIESLGALIARSRGMGARFLLAEPGREVARAFFDRPEVCPLDSSVLNRTVDVDGRRRIIQLHDIRLG